MKLQVRFIGTQVSYSAGMQIMRDCIAHIDTQGNQLIFLEHSDTITFTRQHGTQNLLMPITEIQKRGIEVIETDRGGDVTFHGTGQLVGYPILKLPPSIGVYDYLRKLELALIQACQDFGLFQAHLKPGKTGIWIENKKLIAIGVGVSKQVTRHGFALNLTTHLERFTELITPCGLFGMGVTSLERELDNTPNFEQAAEVLSWHLQSIC